MKFFLVLSAICLLVSCSPDKRRPIDPDMSVVQEQDDPRQEDDVPGIMPIPPPSSKSTVVRDERAWLEPDPSKHKFTHENPFWVTFTVRTSANIDSVFVLVNPQIKRYT